MPELNDLVSVDITVTDKTPSKPNFGMPCIVAYHAVWADRVREYSEPDELLDDGFTVEQQVYQMAVAIKSQNPSLQRFKVGRLSAASVYTHTIELRPTNLITAYEYTGNILGEDFSAVVGSGHTVAQICDTLVADIDPIPGVAAVDNTTHVTVTRGVAGRIIPLIGLSEFLSVKDVTVIDDAALTADLAAINDEDSDWYGFVLDINCAEAISTAAAWAEANEKIFVPMSSDTEILDAGVTTDVMSTMVGQAYTRTGPIFHRDMGGDEWANAAFLAINLQPAPGSYTPAFKTLAGIGVDSLRTGHKSALAAKRCTRYMRQGGVNITYEGRTPSGRFFDVVRFVDWLKAEMQADVYTLLLNNPKLPYTNSGISAVKGAIEGALVKGREAGGVADDSPIVVTAPDITETDIGDRANRILRNVKFSARLSGALHNIRVEGTLSV